MKHSIVELNGQLDLLNIVQVQLAVKREHLVDMSSFSHRENWPGRTMYYLDPKTLELFAMAYSKGGSFILGVAEIPDL